MEKLNNDVLEQIFQYLDFRSLLAAELTCKRWQQLIRYRRLYWQLSKTICRSSIRCPAVIKMQRRSRPLPYRAANSKVKKGIGTRSKKAKN